MKALLIRRNLIQMVIIFNYSKQNLNSYKLTFKNRYNLRNSHRMTFFLCVCICVICDKPQIFLQTWLISANSKENFR